MADLIDRAELIMLFCECPDYSASMFKKIRCRIEAVPAVDAVEVVRCKGCTYGQQWSNVLKIEGFKCKLFCADVNPEGFCSYGERKADER